MRGSILLPGLLGIASAACPYMDAGPGIKERSSLSEKDIHARDVPSEEDFLNQFTVDDSDAFFTTDAGGPIQESTSLKAGERGPTLLEDFIFRQKIQHFDHERVSCAFLLPFSLLILHDRSPNVPFTLVALVSVI